MNDHREPEFVRELNLFAEPVALFFRRGVVVVVVQPDLPVGDDFSTRGQPAEFVVPMVLNVPDLVRVDADRGIDEVMRFREGDGGRRVTFDPIFAKDAPLRTPEQRFASLAQAEEPSFRRHVIPLISRAGCSGRECHGSFQGRGGFQLSLFGYDFEKDHKQMTVNADGDEKQVRINRDQPEKSLLLTKGTNEEAHKGKERYKKGSWEYNLMLKWIQGGAKADVEATGEFDRLEVLPKEIVFKKAGEQVQLKVLAHWKDGTASCGPSRG